MSAAMPSCMKLTLIVAGGLLLPLIAFAVPASALCTGIAEPCQPSSGGHWCRTYESAQTPTYSVTVTECSDGFHCEAHNHYNDPNQRSYTEFVPEGCGDDPRYGT